MIFIVLENETDIPAPEGRTFGSAEGEYVLPGDGQGSAGRTVETSKQIEQGGLSASIWSHDRNETGGLVFKTQILEGGDQARRPGPHVEHVRPEDGDVVSLPGHQSVDRADSVPERGLPSLGDLSLAYLVFHPLLERGEDLGVALPLFRPGGGG